MISIPTMLMLSKKENATWMSIIGTTVFRHGERAVQGELIAQRCRALWLHVRDSQQNVPTVAARKRSSKEQGREIAWGPSTRSSACASERFEKTLFFRW